MMVSNGGNMGKNPSMECNIPGSIYTPLESYYFNKELKVYEYSNKIANCLCQIIVSKIAI